MIEIISKNRKYITNGAFLFISSMMGFVLCVDADKYERKRASYKAVTMVMVIICAFVLFNKAANVGNFDVRYAYAMVLNYIFYSLLRIYFNGIVIINNVDIDEASTMSQEARSEFVFYNAGFSLAISASMVSSYGTYSFRNIIEFLCSLLFSVITFWILLQKNVHMSNTKSR